MNCVDHILLSRFYQIAKISVLILEASLPKIKQTELQTKISNQISKYDVLVEECRTLAKSHSITLPDNTFFKSCKQVIENNFDSFNSINKQVLIAFTITLSLNTLTEIYDVESVNTETINIGKHLQSMQEHNLQTLNQIN